MSPTTTKTTDTLFDTYSVDGDRLVRRLTLGALEVEASVGAPAVRKDPKGSWWHAYLEGVPPEPTAPSGGDLRTVDLFSGTGGLSLGVRQLARELGISLVSELAVDQDEEAVKVYAANHATRSRLSTSVENLLDFAIRRTKTGARFAYPPELVGDVGTAQVDDVDLVLAGPPCQGHSNLNNQTRRDDRRNELYLTVPAFAIACRAKAVVIENVPAVVHDASGVVETAIELLESEGYTVTSGVLSALDMGWPQSRRRHFTIARQDVPPLPIESVAAALADETARSVWWAIGDLEHRHSDALMDQVTELSVENQKRVDWLFDNDEYDLGLEMRPASHRDGTSYTSVYGRLDEAKPAQTITTGFMSPGRGRYVHPTQRRVITPREAARIQGFPDSYRFVVDPERPPSRASLAKWIGDAVPMPLGYAAAVTALGNGLPRPSVD